MQFLYQLDQNPAEPRDLNSIFWSLRGEAPSDKLKGFAESLIKGVLDQKEAIDTRLAAAVQNYQIERIAVVDRNILRLAIYEMLFCMETPPVVAINEAIEIAKRFGNEDSSRFVNGVLDRVRGTIDRPARQALVEFRKKDGKAGK